MKRILFKKDLLEVQNYPESAKLLNRFNEKISSMYYYKRRNSYYSFIVNENNEILKDQDNNYIVNIFDIASSSGGHSPLSISSIKEFIHFIDVYNVDEIDDSINQVYNFIFNLFKRNTIDFDINEYRKNQCNEYRGHNITFLETLSSIVSLYSKYISAYKSYKDIDLLILENETWVEELSKNLYDQIIAKKEDINDEITNENSYFENSQMYSLNSVFEYLLSSLPNELKLDCIMLYNELSRKLFLNIRKNVKGFTYPFKDFMEYLSNDLIVIYLDNLFEIVRDYTNKTHYSDYVRLMNEVFYNNYYPTKEKYESDLNKKLYKLYREKSKYLNEFIRLSEKMIAKYNFPYFEFMLYTFPNDFNWSLFDKNKLLEYIPEGFKVDNFEVIPLVIDTKYEKFIESVNKNLGAFFTFVSLVDKDILEPYIDRIGSDLLSIIANDFFLGKDVVFLTDSNGSVINPENITMILEDLSSKVDATNKVAVYRNYINFLSLSKLTQYANTKNMSKKFKKTYMEEKMK